MFGIYVHIPFCLQHCHYCDFATVTRNDHNEKETYVNYLGKEIQFHSKFVSHRGLSSLYFGGGTPSLLSPKMFEKIFFYLEKAGFIITPQTEVTMEINPGTLSKEQIGDLVDLGFNRFSLGVQSFNDDFLKSCGRRHSSSETRSTLEHLKYKDVLINMDFLFLLPKQNLKNLQEDLKEFLEWNPQHISPYGLDVPSHHSLAKIQPSEPIQTRMYKFLWGELEDNGFQQYEISNFCRNNYKSVHNRLYWNDFSYWGIGLGAHSYFNNDSWGYRFWNPRSQKKYFSQLDNFSHGSTSFKESLPSQQIEILERHNSLTDFCFTNLRKSSGINLSAVRNKFGPPIESHLDSILKNLNPNWIQKVESGYGLTTEGKLFSNRVFEAVTFNKEDIDFFQERPII